jgi:hypothetical protein
MSEIKLTPMPATLCGVAGRISAAEKAALAAKATPAILRATIQVTRAATGQVEEYEIIGTAAELTDTKGT